MEEAHHLAYQELLLIHVTTYLASFLSILPVSEMREHKYESKTVFQFSFCGNSELSYCSKKANMCDNEDDEVSRGKLFTSNPQNACFMNENIQL